MIVRSAISPGRFYPANSLLLFQQVDACYHHPLGPGGFLNEEKCEPPPPCERSPIALIVPHGALGHSGPIAAHAYALLAACAQYEFAQLPQLIVIIGPDHLGLGSAVSATTMSYTTPLGVIPTDDNLVRKMLDINLGEESNESFNEAPSGHASEHSVENQIPFLQHLVFRMTAGTSALPHSTMQIPQIPSLPQIIPLTMSSQNLATARALAMLLDSVLPSSGVLLIASSDMSHCGPLYANIPMQTPPSTSSISNWCELQTKRAVDAIITGDPQELQHIHESAFLSMCGVGCVLTAIEFARLRGATTARLLAQASSVEVASLWARNIPTDQYNNAQSPWNLLKDVDALNPVGFASIALS